VGGIVAVTGRVLVPASAERGTEFTVPVGCVTGPGAQADKYRRRMAVIRSGFIANIFLYNQLIEFKFIRGVLTYFMMTV
jgi:hypothetical protein